MDKFCSNQEIHDGYHAAELQGTGRRSVIN